MRTALLLTAGLTALACAAPARAAIVYQNNFDGENGGVAANGYEGFNGLFLPFAPFGDRVDLIADGDGGRRCAGGGGLCVDLDGGISSQLRTIDSFAFNAGDVVTLRFAASGSQDAASPVDNAVYRFRFDQQTAGSFNFFSTGGATDSGTFDGLFLTEEVGAPFTLGFESVTFSFLAANSGSFRVSFDDFTPCFDPDDGCVPDFDDDDRGRLIDDISIDVSPAPEPATWATMLLGFGAIGLSTRRRRRLPPAVAA